ncbi:AIPR family protein [Nakamurella multipartita]|uniref:Abortive phage infection protein C-terminal domain-containing protein n=1 Tax=Nakamurella multipartita (strain ATCC 700099 / DSM 44233 / CIP 104796 / JCM 9543 / NBRC 105858 / Y-104) TaxID=479431 RepID=C8X8H0_NAKMY|nr:AIPR family protein [Nakamurella multipartita]ACV79025.1 hypothetical protein Namu_2679 [Nakamurella multipartita DSM 44233]
MGRLHVTQIERRLDDTVNKHIDMSDVPFTGDQLRASSLSRGLAAFIVMKVANVDPLTAANSVTDEGGDNGIDAVIALALERRIVMVQAKWASDSRGSAEKADILKFRKGVDDFVSGDWSKFGPKFNAKKSELEPLLYDPSLRIEMIFCHLGTGVLSAESALLMDEYLDDMNNPTEIGSFLYLNQGQVHRMLVDDVVKTKVNLDVELSDWGTLEQEPIAFYGHVSGETIAGWYIENGSSLLSQNVRVLIPDSEVNDGLVATLTDTPGKFWYFNNGLTVLCDRISKAPLGGADRRLGRFTVEGASIVNGAQTAGSLARFSAAAGDLAEVRVLVRFISLENSPADFAKDVTRATNTQNRIGGREFVALDPEQARLRDEFAVAGMTYAFRTGEEAPSPSDGCDVVEATVGLACLHSAQLATQAKREISRLWDDISRAPYRTLFNPSTNYVRVWRSIQVLRMTEDLLRRAREKLDGREKLIATHGNRVVLHLLFRRCDTSSIGDPDHDWESELEKIKGEFEGILEKVFAIVEGEFPGYPASLFKNASKVQSLVYRVLES